MENKFIELQSFDVPNTAQVKEVAVDRKVDRIDIAFRLYFSDSAATSAVDGDKSMVEDFVSNIRVVGINGTILNMSGALCRKIIVPFVGSLPEDRVLRSTTQICIATGIIAIPCFQHVKSVQISTTAGSQTDGALVTKAGTMTITATCAVYAVKDPSIPEDRKMPMIYRDFSLTTGTSFSEILSAMEKPLLNLILSPAADYLSSLKVSDGGILLVDTSMPAYLDMEQKLSQDIENFLADLDYGSGTAVLDYNRGRRKAGEIYVDLGGYRCETKSLHVTGTASATTTLQIIASMLDIH